MVMGQAPTDPLRSVAAGYVKMVLALGQHDPDYVDAFYGPSEWRKEIEASKPSLASIDEHALSLERELAKAPTAPPVPRDAELWKLRLEYLARQLSALRARVAMLQGKRFTFDEESRALYDATAPVNSEDHFRKLRARLEAELVFTALVERLPTLDLPEKEAPAWRRTFTLRGLHKLPAVWH